MTQVARNLTDAGDGFLQGFRYLIVDRDPLYTAAFRRLLRGSGVEPLVLPAWSSNLNAFAERFVGSAKSECLERIVPLGERHLRRPYERLSGMIMRSGRTKVWATNSSRPRPRRLAQAPSRAVRGSAACSSSITARPRSPMGRVFAPDGIRYRRTCGHARPKRIGLAVKPTDWHRARHVRQSTRPRDRGVLTAVPTTGPDLTGQDVRRRSREPETARRARRSAEPCAG